MTSEAATGGPFDVDAVAGALRWVVGRAPRQADEAADRELLRALAAALDPAPADPSPRALDAHLDAVLAEMAASGEIADHCAPRHRGWMLDVARIYVGDPAALPQDLRDRIGSETVLSHLHDGVTNRARAAALALDVDPNLIRVRREPVLLDALATALVARATPGSAPPADRPLATPGRSRRGRVVAGLGALVVAAVAVVAVWVWAAADEEAPAPRTGPVGVAVPAVVDPVVALGLDGEGGLVALTEGGVVDLGLDDVAAADAARDGDRVHVVAERGDGHLHHATLGPAPGRWLDLGAGRAATIGATTEATAVVVAGRGPDGDLAHRTIGHDGRPAGGWSRLSATGVVDVDMAVNLDGRLEVGGVTEDGTAFNVWQSEPPHGWSSFSDDRGGEAGTRTQLLTNADGRLELWVERPGGVLWNTWQVAQGRGWTDEWDPRWFEGVRDWRVAVGAGGRLVAAALTADGVVLRQQVPVPQADGTTRLMWPPSTIVTTLDPLDGVVPDALTVVEDDDGARVVASGDGRTVAVPVGLEGPGDPEPVAPVAVAELVPVDG